MDFGTDRRRAVHLAGLLCASALYSLPACATELRVSVVSAGKPVGDAVVSLHSAAAAAAVRPGRAVVDQRGTRFIPRVSVVTTGTPVQFPNSDDVRHQVYSFSPAKRFELPLYSGRTAPPVVFDAPGVVVLGCNIHDWMVAYVVVVDSPYRALSDAAGAAVVDAPPGSYTLRVWHPEIKGGQPIEQSLVLSGAAQQRSLALTLENTLAPAAPGDEKLRALQERFRKLKARD